MMTLTRDDRAFILDVAKVILRVLYYIAGELFSHVHTTGYNELDAIRTQYSMIDKN